MNIRSFLPGFVAFALSFQANSAFAQQYYDGAGTTGNGVVNGGSGVWNATTTNWTTSDGSTNSAWTSGTAVFGLGGTGLYTVTLSTDPLSATGLIFNTGGYSLTSNSLALAGTPTIQVVRGAATIGSTLTGTSGFTKTGSGLLALTGNNSGLSGGITLNSGMLQASTNANALGGSGNALTLSGGILQLTDATGFNWGNNTTVSGNSAIFLDRGAAGAGVTETLGTLNIGNQTLTVFGGGATTSGVAGLTFGATTLTGSSSLLQVNNRTTGGATLVTLGAVSVTGGGTSNLVKGGDGNLTFGSTVDLGGGSYTQYFNGARTTASGTTIFTNAVSGTGALNLYSGVVTLAGANATLATTDVKLLGATLNLGVAADSFLANRLNSSTDLVMGGGRLVDASTTAGAATQTINSLTLKPGASFIFGAGAATHTLTITNPAVTREIGSVIGFDEGANFKVGFASQPTLIGGASAATGGIIGGWATYIGDFASVNAFGTIAAVTYDSNNSINTFGANSTISQTISNATVNLLTSSTINALRVFSSSGSAPGKLDLGGNVLNITSGGLIIYSAGAASASIQNGTITAGTTANAEIFLHTQNFGSNTSISAAFADNGAGAVHLVRGGTASSNGTLYLSGESTYTGKTVLALRNDVAAVSEYSTVPSAQTIILSERQLGAMPAPGAVVADKLVLNNATLQFGASAAPSWAPERGITLGGLGGEIYASLTPLNSIALNISAPISGTGPLFLYSNIGSGFLGMTLSGSNTFDGQLSVSGQNAVEAYTSIGNVGSTAATALGSPSNASNGLIRLVGSTNLPEFAYVGTGTASSDRDFQMTSGYQVSASGVGSLTLSGNMYLQSGAIPRLSGAGSGVFSGNIIQGDSTVASTLTKIGTGTWTLTGQNTYTGATSISGGGVLEYTTIGNIGAGPSSLGAPTTLASGTISLGTHSYLRFVGSADQSSDRVIALASGNNNFPYYLDASGANNSVLTLTGGINNLNSSNSQTFTLLGTGKGVESGVIGAGAGGTTNLLKAGIGTWTLNPSSPETYAGSTIIGGGNLILDYSNLSTPTNLVSSASALVFGNTLTQFNSAGTLTLQGKSGQAISQTFANTAFPAGGAVLNLNPGATATSVAVTTGSVNRTNGSTLDIRTAGTATVTTGTIVVQNGLIPWATYNSNEFATGTTSGGVLSPYSGYVGALPATGSVVSNSYTLTTGMTLTGNSPLAALKITPSSDNLVLDLATQTLASSNAGLSTSGFGLLYDGGTNGYTYTIGNGVFGGNMEKIFHIASGTLNVSANLNTTGGNVTKAGVGTLILSGSNNGYTGNTFVNMGTLKAGSTTAFSPLSAFTVGESGTLALNGYNNTIQNINGNSTGRIVNGSDVSPATLTLQPSVTTGSNVQTTGYGQYTAINSIIADGGSQPLSLVWNGLTGLHIGQVNYSTNYAFPLWGNLGNNTFTGDVTIKNGFIYVPTVTDSGVSGPLGAGKNLILGDSAQGTEGILQYAGHNGATNRTIVLPAGGVGGFQLSDNTAGAASTMFGATLTLTGTVTGGGMLDKLESGNLVLTNTANNYTGGSIVRGGVLQFASGALPSTGSITVVPGGAVAAAWNFGNSDFLNRIASNSVGVVALGANNNSSLDFTNLPGVSLGTNNAPQSFFGSITPAGSTYRLGGGGATSALLLQKANVLTGANDVLIGNAGSAGALVEFSDGQNYTGATTITPTPYNASLGVSTTGVGVPAVTLVLAGQNASIANSSAINLNPSSTLRIVESVGATAKLGASTPVNFNGGTLLYQNDGSNGTFALSTGTLNLNRGVNFISVSVASNTGGTSSVTFSGLNRTAGATMDFTTASTFNVNQQVKINGAPTLGAWATVNSEAGFAAYDVTNSNNIVKAAETYAANFSSLSPTTNYFINNIASGFGTQTALTVRGTNAVTISMLATDTLNTNAFMSGGGSPLTIGNTAGVGTVGLPGGATELFMHMSASRSITVNANISIGNNSLVSGGVSNGTLTLSGSNTFGSLYINQSQVTISTTNALTPGATVILGGNGAVLKSNTGSYNNPIIVNGDSYITNTGSVTLSGNITLNNNASLIFQGGQVSPINCNGVISGNGGLILENNPTNTGGVISPFIFGGTAANTYTGLTQIIGPPSAVNGAGGQTILLQNSGGVAIPGDILLGKRSTSSSAAGRQNPETLRINIGGGDQIANTSLITFGGGTGIDAGALQLFGHDETIRAIQSQGAADGIVESGTNTATLTTAGANASDTFTFTGIMRNGAAANSVLAYNKSGAYTQVLTGINLYTGTTTISSGTLQLGNGGVNGSLSPSSTIVNDATLVFNRSTSVVQGTDFSANLSGAGVVVQAGSGTLNLNAANAFNGGMIVAAGKLAANNSTGSATGSGPVNVLSGATLSGTGSIAGALSVTGTVAPGNSIGTLTINNNVTFASGGTLNVELDADGNTSDRLAIVGNLDLSGVDALTVSLLNSAPTGSNSFIIATYTGTVTGTFDSVTPGYVVDYGVLNANAITLVIPEPSAFLMLVSGIGILALARRRRA